VEVDRSFDNVPFNDNDSDDEENEDNEILFEPEVQPNVIVFEPEVRLGRPIRNRNISSRFMRKQTPPPPIRNHRRNPPNNPQVNVIPPINNVQMNNPQVDVIAPNNPQVNVVPQISKGYKLKKRLEADDRLQMLYEETKRFSDFL
jgi:hypothetical protein